MKLQRQWTQKVIGDQENRPRKKLPCFFRGRFLWRILGGRELFCGSSLRHVCSGPYRRKAVRARYRKKGNTAQFAADAYCGAA